MATFDVLVIGAVGIDTIVRVPDLAVPPGDSLGVGPIYDYVAHSGNGVALGFHSLGLRTKFIDFLGEDRLGAMILARYAERGLDFSYLPAPNGTPRAVNLVDDAGRRFSFYDGRHPDGVKLPREFYLPYLEQSRHVHVAADRAEAPFADARERGISTSTDVHAWDGVNPWAVPIVYEADIVFLSAAGVPDRIDDVMRAILARGRATLVVATEGADGCRILARDTSVVRRFPPVVPPRAVVDSNGAGDGFSTAFLSRWLAGAAVEDCVLAGAVSGAFACGITGTHEEFITADQLAAGTATAQWGPARMP